MKGISAVIAVVLILMITVALASMAYVWFTTVFRTITTGTEEAAIGGIAAMATKFTIESAHNDTLTNIAVSIRNTGTTDINMGTIAAYVNGVSKVDDATGTLTSGNVGSFGVTVTTVPCDGILKVTEATGYEAYATIKC